MGCSINYPQGSGLKEKFFQWLEGHFLNLCFPEGGAGGTKLCFLVGGRVSHEQFLHTGFIFVAVSFWTKLPISSYLHSHCKLEKNCHTDIKPMKQT